MATDLRVVLLAMLVAVILAGGLLAAVVINGTSGGSPAPLTSASAIAAATRSLPPYWVVRPGDTFTSIATQNHLTVVQLQELNPTQDSSALLAGQRLRLHPQGPGRHVRRRVVPRLWVVRRGDTFSSIAVKTGVQTPDIAQLNPAVNPNLLRPGQQLKLRP